MTSKNQVNTLTADLYPNMYKVNWYMQKYHTLTMVNVDYAKRKQRNQWSVFIKKVEKVLDFSNSN